MTVRSLTDAALRHLSRVALPVIDAGIGNPVAIGTGPVVLESTGRRSGETRRTALLSLRVGDRLAVSTVRTGSDWVANLQADPRARVRLFGRDRDVVSEIHELPGLRVAVLRLS